MTATDQDGSVIETTTSHNFDNSRFFDPPVENYRFMAAENAFRMEQRPGRRNIFISQSWSAANRPLMNSPTSQPPSEFRDSLLENGINHKQTLVHAEDQEVENANEKTYIVEEPELASDDDSFS